MKNKIAGFILLFSIFTVFSAIPNIASAQITTGLKIQPVKASHVIEKGEEIKGVITLTNASNENVNVSMVIEDFEPGAGSDRYNFVGRSDGVTTVLDWIKLDTPEDFIFERNSKKEINYTITAPSDAEPGSHFGVIFFKASPLSSDGQLKVSARVGVLIFVTVPGNFLQQGNILDFSTDKFVTGRNVEFITKFENTGTVHFEPRGKITITNTFGKVVGELDVLGTAVLPTGVKDLKKTWEVNKPLLGVYKASISLKDGEGNELTADQVRFIAFPVWYLFWIIVGIIVIFVGFKFIKNKLNISVSVKRKEDE